MDTSRKTYVHQVVKKFPHLKNFSVHFHNKFTICQPKSMSFKNRLKKITPRLFAKLEGKNFLEMAMLMDQFGKNKFNKMEIVLCCLSFYLTSTLKRTKRASPVEVLEDFILSKLSGFPIMTIIDEFRHIKKNHPVVLTLGCPNDLYQIFICVDGEAYKLIKGGLVSAVEKLVELYFIMYMNILATLYSNFLK